jgi:hypothetical protein
MSRHGGGVAQAHSILQAAARTKTGAGCPGIQNSMDYLRVRTLTQAESESEGPEFPGPLESTNLSLEILSMETGRTTRTWVRK